MNLGAFFGLAFVLSGGWFWFVLLAEAILFSTACWSGRSFPWFLTLILGAVLIVFSDLGGFFTWISEHPYETVSIAAGYVGLGAVYSIAKWWLFIREENNIEQRKDDYAKYKKYSGLDNPSVEDFKNSIYNGLVPRKYKSLILTWMVIWPLSGLWTLTHDIFENIYNGLVKVYTNISNKHLDSILKD